MRPRAKYLYPRRMLKIGCKPCATIGSMHGGINRWDAGYEWQPNILRHARAGCQKSGENHVQLLVHAWRLSIAGKPVSRGGQTPCITPGQDVKIGCKPYAVIRSIHGGINRRKAGYEWWPNNLYHAGQDAKNRKQTIRGYRVHVRWPSIARKAGSSRSHKPFASAYTFISGDGAQSWP